MTQSLFWLYLSSIFNLLSGFLLVTLYVSKLGWEQFGIISTFSIFSLTGYLSLAELGFQTAITKYVSEYQAKNKYHKISQLLSSSILLFFIIGAILGIIGLTLVNHITHSVNIPMQYINGFKQVLTLCFLTYLVQFPNLILIAALQGLHRFDLIKTNELVTNILKVLAIFALVFLGYNFFEVLLAILFTTLLQALINLVLIKLNCPQISIQLKYANLNSLKSIAHFTKWTFIGKVSNLAFQQTDRVLISIILGPIYLGIYEVIVRIPMSLKSLLGQINLVVLPTASHLGDIKIQQISQLYKNSFKFQISQIYPTAFSFMIFGGFFLKNWLEPNAANYYPYLLFFLLFNLLTPLSTIGQSVLGGLNKYLKELTLITLSSAILNLVISFIGIYYWKLWGVFAGTILALFLSLPFKQHYFNKVLKSNSKELLTFIFKITLICLPINILFYLLPKHIYENSMSFTIFLIILNVLLQWIAIYLTLFKSLKISHLRKELFFR